ncbi:acid phosphatase-domain-containing protein [Mycena sanguinolenta]|nr:acid phosphatase-domain-containing protein [Mycena sanguinolenta]
MLWRLVGNVIEGTTDIIVAGMDIAHTTIDATLDATGVSVIIPKFCHEVCDGIQSVIRNTTDDIGKTAGKIGRHLDQETLHGPDKSLGGNFRNSPNDPGPDPQTADSSDKYRNFRTSHPSSVSTNANEYPKLVALDLDWTIWRGWLDKNQFGKGPNASHVIEDNLERAEFWTIRDSSDSNKTISLFEGVDAIVTDLASHGVQIAVVSRNTSKALCDRALWHFPARDPSTGQYRSIIDFVKYNEVADESKTEHFRRIQNYSGLSYSDMILFDDEARNNVVERELGVTFKVVWDRQGLTWPAYQEGLSLWRRNKRFNIRPGSDNQLHPKPKFIGWVGASKENMLRYCNGQRRLDYARPSRWGYGLYITDDANVAKFFATWMRPDPADRWVCAMFVWDGDVFDQVPKIWIPESFPMQTDNYHWSEENIAWRQEDLDRTMARDYGIQKPYILFSKHHRMDEMDRSIWGPFNEMVVYPQLQDALFFCPWARQVHEFNPDPTFSFEEVIDKWRITDRRTG